MLVLCIFYSIRKMRVLLLESTIIDRQNEVHVTLSTTNTVTIPVFALTVGFNVAGLSAPKTRAHISLCWDLVDGCNNISSKGTALTRLKLYRLHEVSEFLGLTQMVHP